MIPIVWLLLAGAGFLCGLFFGARRGSLLLGLLVAGFAIYDAWSSHDGGFGVALVFTMGAGFVLMFGGGGFATGWVIRRLLLAIRAQKMK